MNEDIRLLYLWKTRARQKHKRGKAFRRGSQPVPLRTVGGPGGYRPLAGFRGSDPVWNQEWGGNKLGPAPFIPKWGAVAPPPSPFPTPRFFFFLIQTNENQICNHTRFISLGLNYLCNTKNRFVKEYDTDTADKILIPSRCWQRYERNSMYNFPQTFCRPEYIILRSTHAAQFLM